MFQSVLLLTMRFADLVIVIMFIFSVTTYLNNQTDSQFFTRSLKYTLKSKLKKTIKQNPWCLIVGIGRHNTPRLSCHLEANILVYTLKAMLYIFNIFKQIKLMKNEPISLKSAFLKQCIYTFCLFKNISKQLHVKQV